MLARDAVGATHFLGQRNTSAQFGKFRLPTGRRGLLCGVAKVSHRALATFPGLCSRRYGTWRGCKVSQQTLMVPRRPPRSMERRAEWRSRAIPPVALRGSAFWPCRPACCAALHNPPQNAGAGRSIRSDRAACPGTPGADRAHDRARRGRSVRQSCSAGRAGDQPPHRGRCTGRRHDRGADRAPARRRVRRSCAPHRRLCRRHRCRGAYRRPEGAGAAPAAAGSQRQSGALGGISRPGGAHALRGGVHRASDIRTSASRRACTGGGRERARWPRLLVRIGRRRSRLRTNSPRQSPPSPMAAMRSTSSTPRCCRWRAERGRIAGPNSTRGR